MNNFNPLFQEMRRPYADTDANYGLDPRNIELYPTRFMKRGLQESDVIPIPLKTGDFAMKDIPDMPMRFAPINPKCRHMLHGGDYTLEII
jgi:hypothetical protein